LDDYDALVLVRGGATKRDATVAPEALPQRVLAVTGGDDDRQN